MTDPAARLGASTPEVTAEGSGQRGSSMARSRPEPTELLSRGFTTVLTDTSCLPGPIGRSGLTEVALLPLLFRGLQNLTCQRPGVAHAWGWLGRMAGFPLLHVRWGSVTRKITPPDSPLCQAFFMLSGPAFFFIYLFQG